MTFNDIALQRYSCRAYLPRPVEPEKLEAVLEAARIAPSACNRQPWLFLVVDDPQARRWVIESYDREWIKSAPVFIIAFGLHEQAWSRPADGKDHTDVDLSIAIEHICLAAVEQGLATCWVCNFDPEIIRNRFNAPDNCEPIAIIPLGYPADGPVPEKKRKSLGEIVRVNSLDRPYDQK